MVRVETCYYDDLTEDRKQEVSNNGFGCEYATYIKVIHDGQVVGIFSDAMEPEDATFGRDLGWISGMLIKCYNWGKEEK